jgi:hypothetical protein
MGRNGKKERKNEGLLMTERCALSVDVSLGTM